MRRDIRSILRKVAAGEMPAGDPAAMGGAAPPPAAPPADPAAGGSGGMMPGVAEEPPLAPPQQPMGGMGMQPGQPGQMPGMMPQQAPKTKIDPGSAIIQTVRMLTAALEKLQGSQSEGVDPGVIQAALGHAENSMASLVSQGEGGKSKVDINNGLVIIQKLSAALVDAMGIPIPASHMVATPDEMMSQGQPGQQQPAADPGAMQDPNAQGGGMPAQPIEPIQPLTADGQAPKTASDDFIEPGIPATMPRYGVVGLPAPLNTSILSRIKRIRT